MDQENAWIVIGLSGPTCAGKSTLANSLKKFISNLIIVSQDDYFLPIDSPKHSIIPELNQINWEILTSLDMEKMMTDIKNILNNTADQEKQIQTQCEQIKIECLDESCMEKTNEKLNNEIVAEHVCIFRDVLKGFMEKNIKVLVVEGFSIFNYKPIEKLCDLKYYITITKDVSYARRCVRPYFGCSPDVPGYFDMTVWPEHLRQKSEVFNCVKDLKIMDGCVCTEIDYLNIIASDLKTITTEKTNE